MSAIILAALARSARRDRGLATLTEPCARSLLYCAPLTRGPRKSAVASQTAPRFAVQAVLG
jgi:hypothetical protein